MIAHEIASCAKLPPAAQRAAVNSPTLHKALFNNPSTDFVEDVWLSLWSQKPKADAAKSLLSRPVPRTHRDTVRMFEKRVSVLGVLAGTNDLDLDEIEALLEHTQASKLAAAILTRCAETTRTLPEDLFERCSRVAGGVHLIALMCAGRVPLGEIQELLLTISDWAPKRSTPRKELLHLLLCDNPGLLDVYIAAPVESNLPSVAGGSHVIMAETAQQALIENLLSTSDETGRSYAMLGLLNNPVAHRSTVERIKDLYSDGPLKGDPKAWEIYSGTARRLGDWRQVTDPVAAVHAEDGLLGWLVRRSVPRYFDDGGHNTGRPWDVPALAANPQLTAEHASRIIEGFENCSGPAVLAARVNDAIAVLRERFEELESPAGDEALDAEYRYSTDGVPVPEPPLTRRMSNLPHMPVGSLNAAVAMFDEVFDGTEGWTVAFSLMDESEDLTVQEFADLIVAIG